MARERLVRCRCSGTNYTEDLPAEMKMSCRTCRVPWAKHVPSALSTDMPDAQYSPVLHTSRHSSGCGLIGAQRFDCFGDCSLLFGPQLASNLSGFVSSFFFFSTPDVTRQCCQDMPGHFASRSLRPWLHTSPPSGACIRQRSHSGQSAVSEDCTPRLDNGAHRAICLQGSRRVFDVLAGVEKGAERKRE